MLRLADDCAMEFLEPLMPSGGELLSLPAMVLGGRNERCQFCSNRAEQGRHDRVRPREAVKSRLVSDTIVLAAEQLLKFPTTQSMSTCWHTTPTILIG